MRSGHRPGKGPCTAQRKSSLIASPACFHSVVSSPFLYASMIRSSLASSLALRLPRTSSSCRPAGTSRCTERFTHKDEERQQNSSGDLRPSPLTWCIYARSSDADSGALEYADSVSSLLSAAARCRSSSTPMRRRAQDMAVPSWASMLETEGGYGHLDPAPHGLPAPSWPAYEATAPAHWQEVDEQARVPSRREANEANLESTGGSPFSANAESGDGVFHLARLLYAISNAAASRRLVPALLGTTRPLCSARLSRPHLASSRLLPLAAASATWPLSLLHGARLAADLSSQRTCVDRAAYAAIPLRYTRQLPNAVVARRTVDCIRGRERRSV